MPENSVYGQKQTRSPTVLITKSLMEQTCAYTEILPMEEPDQRCTLAGSGP